MNRKALNHFKRVHLQWRQTYRDLKALGELRKRLEEREYRLAHRNDGLFARLHPKDKAKVRTWIGRLNRRAPLRSARSAEELQD